VRIEDVEAATPVHQHLGEPGIPDDRVDHQRVLTRIGDAIWVILAAESKASFDQSRKEGDAFFTARTSCRSRLRWLLDMSTVAP
jgi:hypothetical protein